jgi:hypothetical protein
MISAPHITPEEHSGEDHNKDCEGFGCQEMATEQLDLPCGEYGSLLVFLCKGCLEKIQNMERS